ncbi:MAG: AbrB/MazE/SpoVT family DNA-binding domain-containing protein [Acidimicrobiaceae bacterium]|nr:AbrB/MazE/SpoVT family DNA-binding domain-containing protein [Acidimicrobiaceae bacterium]
MDATYNIMMGDRGRVVIPADVRTRACLEPGTPLVLMETEAGLLLSTQAQILEWIRAGLADTDITGELLAERRLEAAREDSRTERWRADGEATDTAEDAA